MWLNRAFGHDLISSATALEMAQRILLERVGETRAHAQQPLSIIDENGIWTIRGRELSPVFPLPQHIEECGIYCICIAKADGQIKDLTFETPVTIPKKIDE